MQLDEAELITFPPPPTQQLSIVVGEGARAAQLMRHDFTPIAVFSNQRVASHQVILESELAGHFLLLGTDYADPARPITLAENLSEPLPERFVMDFARRAIPQPGPGYLAGNFPDGVTMVEGTPTAAVIRVHYRGDAGVPGDGSLVAEVTSAQDGSWRVDNLNPALKFDVICRYEGFNDLILSNVRPVPAAIDPLQLVGSFTVDPLDPAWLVGTAQLSGGWGPFALSIEGAVPLGIEFALSLDGTLTVSGASRESGVYEFDLVVTDALDSRASLTVSAEFDASDPYWGSVTSLVRFEEQAVVDLATVPVTWESPPNCSFTEDGAARFNGAGNFLQAATTAYSGHALSNTDDFTIEAFIRLNELPEGSNTFLSKGRNGSTLNYWFNVTATGLSWIQSNTGAGGSTTSLSAAVTWELGKWHHVAITNQATTRRLFLDGVLLGELTYTGSWMTSDDPLRLGSLDYGSSYWYWFRGDILEARFTKGVARYTDTFRVPVAPLPAF